ncbi:DUF2381 family protein [Myxococcaceae bacterium GXIMD 01537]
MAPGTETTVGFDRPLAPGGVVLESGRERFKWFEVTGQSVRVEPASELRPGELLRVRATFADGLDPQRVTLSLIASSSAPHASVQVVRQPRTMGELLAALHESRTQLSVARQQLASRVEPSLPVDTIDLLFSEVFTRGSIAGTQAYDVPVKTSSNVGTVQLGYYRVNGRFFIVVTLLDSTLSASALPWSKEHIGLLRNATQETTWALSIEARPMRGALGGALRIVVEFDPPKARNRGLFTLTLGDENAQPILKWSTLEFSL